jgi:hypothetical protein
MQHYPMSEDGNEDRLTLQAIHDYCLARCQAGEGSSLTAEQQARRRAYARVVIAVRELQAEVKT